MGDKFDNLRMATRNFIEQLGASRDEELFEFRNAATVAVIHELLREYDRLREQAAVPVVTHSLGALTADEATVVEALRQVDDEHKTMIRIAANVAVQGEAERRTRHRCDVVDLATARRPQG